MTLKTSHVIKSYDTKKKSSEVKLNINSRAVTIKIFQNLKYSVHF